jgi:hypothetical protein
LGTHPATDLRHFAAFYSPVADLYLGGAMEASDAHD